MSRSWALCFPRAALALATAALAWTTSAWMRSAATRAPLNFSASCSCLVLSRSSSDDSWAAWARLSEMGSAATPGTDVIAMPSTTRTGTRARQAGPWCLTTEPKRNRRLAVARKWSLMAEHVGIISAGRAAGPPHRARCRRKPGDDVLHGYAVNLDERVASADVRVGGQLGHVQHRSGS